MELIKEENGKYYAMHCGELEPSAFSALSSELARRIVAALAEKRKYPKQLSKELKEHEQNIYYHIRKLEAAGLIMAVNEEMVNGASARFYGLSSEGFAFVIGRFRESTKPLRKESEFLEPFIVNGEFSALIVVGSPDPHGPQKARSRDGYFGMDLALFLGSFLNYIPDSKVRLDTEITKEELEQNNLIVIGGPIVNRISGLCNDELPISIDLEKRCIASKLSHKEYYSEECGYIVKAQSPFNEEKEVLVIAGLRNAGTKACIISFLKHFSELQKGNGFRNKVHARVVEGIDLDSDGRIDDVEFLE